MWSMKSSQLILLVSAFLIGMNNFKYFSGVEQVFPFTNNYLFLISLAVWLFSLLNILLFTICNKYTIKPTLIFILIISSLVHYFSSNFGIAVDDNMITNIAQTNIDESMDLLSPEMIYYLMILGLIPSILIYKTKIIKVTIKKEIWINTKYIMSFIVIFIAITILFSKSYTSLIREHRDLRYHINPMYWVYAVGKSVGMQLETVAKPFVQIGADARVIKKDGRRKIVVMVLGETARADRFSLNGYERITNPLLEGENVITYTNMSSCGTDTAYSVPCMFSYLNKSEYNHSEGKNMSNILDIVNKTGVEVYWLDNNSDSKSVADRVNYISYKNSKQNSICDIECRDEGMVLDLQKYIDESGEKDLLIVLHQMGSHGPAYYKRYPEKYKKFTPVCETNQLNECSNEQINNAYDNTIMYTDFILSEIIQLLKKNKDHESMMFYMSDHGESLGENGLYLHGMPNFIAPKEQTHVGSVIWFNDLFRQKINIKRTNLEAVTNHSHDELFHTLLGTFDIKTKLYNKQLDLIIYK